MNLIERFTTKQSVIIDHSNEGLPPVLVPYKQTTNYTFDNSSVFCSNLQDKAVELIETAKDTLVLSTFLLADKRVESAIYAAAKRNVRVYVLLACETRLEGEEPDDEFGKMCLAQHKAMLTKLSGLVHFASAPHFHAKAIIVDSLHNTGEAKGLLLTANLTEEALSRNEELAVSLSQTQIAELTKIFRWAIFESAEHHMIKQGEFASYKSPGNTPYPTGLIETLVTSSEGTVIREHALKLIQQAKNELIISSFGWQEDHILVKAICSIAMAGVNVTILSRKRPAAMPALLAMQQAGATVKCFKWLHAKAILVDDKKAMVMSANFQTHGMDEGFELGLPLIGSQITELKHCIEKFLTVEHQELRTSMALGRVLGDFEVWENSMFKSYFAKELSVIELAPIDSRCLSDMTLKPSLPKANWRSNTSHKVEFKWVVTPPVITGSKPESFIPQEDKIDKISKHKKSLPQKSYKPKVVKLSKKQLAITVRTESDFDIAQKLKQTKLPQAFIMLEA